MSELASTVGLVVIVVLYMSVGVLAVLGSWTERSSPRFSFDDGDFVALSFRTNFVVRWEYLPGSTLFFIWQLNRGDNFSVQDPDPANLGNLFDSISAPGQSFFALKITYWLAI